MVECWLDIRYKFLVDIVYGCIEDALNVLAASNALGLRPEGGGVWNRSRAPHCFGYEYEKHFGRPFEADKLSKAHERVWRNSAMWPNVPPVDDFYADAFVPDCLREFRMLAEEQDRKEREERAKRKDAYRVHYNEVRRKRRRKRREDMREEAQRSRISCK